MAATPLPESILIVGGGVFGLSTALALSRRHSGKITLVESSPTIPNPHGSSVDASRIIRADYANDAYARLATAAIEQWRTTEWGHEGRYNRNGLVLVSSGSAETGAYVRSSYENVKALDKSGKEVELLPTKEDVESVVPGYGTGNNVAGGYVNWGSGWGDAEASVRFAKQLLDETGRVEFKTGNVKRLLSIPDQGSKRKVTGVELSDCTTISADLVILAAGAWTGQLVDLRGRADATGQVLAYIQITDEEQARLANMPTILNFSTGMFIIPPRNNLLKVARHAYGYRNPKSVPDPSGGNGTIEPSLPENGVPIPPEGEQACRTALQEMLPAFADRPFVKTRICWYSDTPKGDFLITHHPTYTSLFLATGGSGHGFKFLPVIGDKVVDALEGKLDPELKQLWSWPEQLAVANGEIPVVWTEDGSRSGPKGMILAEELAKNNKRMGSKL
ncbi:fructosyl amino acid oxidasesarcosine oxidase [Coccidioides immitis RS]|uniref:Fructosyl amino acid oxidasesarcosine oxidase n=4 Tax=Coccidioides immitis TaxID=5501 RepID=J3KBL9_COCIM|nr:fructosyl amino acid oxidasesarcosine oxidase [Coccidioides immitis RS]KMP07770.1 L-pipecolate oxidase [Coccidioides immitis RMSCC 2394]KMU71773.1 fructosyl-amino acid oxidase [Coccidioides immitis RMSCC 3703]KMU82858.1 L-pipecolate oxidase [Coccidioides immitis H538.4]TPX25228.1 hypothetical protein DIZ76_010678 [Coccidioides immitis]EAS32530.3 fructosyl amino acid oxidasesarcosine oxidase [Coccidioides immitis RS]